MITIGPITSTELPYLERAVLNAIHFPDGRVADRSFLAEPVYRATLDDWGRRGDIAMVARDGTEPVGAAWVRLYSDERPTYGYIDPETPTLVISLEAGFRGRGVGTRLMRALIDAVRDAGLAAISLSVDPNNAAVRFYERLGFEPAEPRPTAEDDRNPVMILRF